MPAQSAQTSDTIEAQDLVATSSRFGTIITITGGRNIKKQSFSDRGKRAAAEFSEAVREHKYFLAILVLLLTSVIILPVLCVVLSGKKV